ncbi:MAG: hypothetical protein FJ263_11550 [Planctomycetes bacterium]|nr:hypothetical protein [Planctomycetota bacterium]
MIEKDVLKVVLQRLGPGAAIPSITSQLKGVLTDVSSRADFLTAESSLATVTGQAEYVQPANLKNIYEITFVNGPILDKKTYRQYLKAIEAGTSLSGKPANYAIRHQKIYLWPVPDQVYSLKIDHSIVHPQVFTDILFETDFNEAIIEGVLAQLWREKNQGIDESENPHKTAFEAEIEKLIAGLDGDPAIVEYRDI